jgi:hypothetical protein
VIYKRSPSGERAAATLIVAMPKITLRDRLAKIGAKIARFGRPITLRTAEAKLPRPLFGATLARNSQVPTPPVPA